MPRYIYEYFVEEPCGNSFSNKIHLKKKKIQKPPCTARSDITGKTNKRCHDIFNHIFHWLSHFLIVLMWKIKRKWISSPPSFKGRRWGKCSFLVIFHSNSTINHVNQRRISSWRSWYLSFVSIMHLEGAVQRNFELYFFPRNWFAKNKVHSFCCAARCKGMIETNKWYHYLRNAILHWLGCFICVSVENEVKKGTSSPPSFKGRRWGKCSFLFIFHSKSTRNHINQFRLSSWMSWYISFVSIVSSEGAVQRNFALCFFCFLHGEKQSAIVLLRSTLHMCNTNKWTMSLHPRCNSALIGVLHLYLCGKWSEKEDFLTSFL